MTRRIFIYIVLITTTLFLFISAFALMTNPNGYSFDVIIRNFLIDIPICIAVGFIDYYMIHYLRTRLCKTTVSIILEVLMVSCVIGLLAFALFIVFTKNPVAQALSFFIGNGIIILFIELYLYNKAQVENEKRIIEIERETAIYQFNTLKNQVNPHFLFNSLNVLSSLAYKSPELTNSFAKKLSNVYRYLLTTTQHTSVSLEEELRFLDTYIYLEKTRFGENLEIAINNYDKWRKCRVIPASTQILLENALKHNIASSEHPLRIDIAIDYRGIAVSNNLQLRNNVAKSGIGLENLKKQYAIFGQNIVVTRTDTIFCVILPFLENPSSQILTQ